MAVIRGAERKVWWLIAHGVVWCPPRPLPRRIGSTEPPHGGQPASPLRMRGGVGAAPQASLRPRPLCPPRLPFLYQARPRGIALCPEETGAASL